eukprot:jgi/Botrbrau1/5439/Bobra.182_1s0041.1
MAFRVTVNKCQAVATWTWGAEDDVCVIHRSPFDGCAPDQKYPGDDRHVSWGVCVHTPFRCSASINGLEGKHNVANLPATQLGVQIADFFGHRPQA